MLTMTSDGIWACRRKDIILDFPRNITGILYLSIIPPLDFPRNITGILYSSLIPHYNMRIVIEKCWEISTIRIKNSLMLSFKVSILHVKFCTVFTQKSYVYIYAYVSYSWPNGWTELAEIFWRNPWIPMR